MGEIKFLVAVYLAVEMARPLGKQQTLTTERRITFESNDNIE